MAAENIIAVLNKQKPKKLCKSRSVYKVVKGCECGATTEERND